MNNTPNRRERRAMYKQAGFLKAKNMFGYGSPQTNALYEKTREDGKKIHEQNENAFRDAVEHQLQIKLDRQKETWSETGYNEAEIALLEESWILMASKNKDSYREDKKRSKELIKQVSQLRLARK